MTAQTWRFTPLDSCFFRESRPMDSIGGSEMTSIFPPPIRTVLGAVRTAIGEHNQVDWNSYFSNDRYTYLREQLGTGNDLSGIQVNGPWLVQKINEQWQRLYPVPLNQVGIIKQGKVEKIIALQPADKPCRCDLGKNVRPAIVSSGIQGVSSLADYWITGETLTQLLSGSGKTIPPKALISSSDLFIEEPRLGIARNNSLRAVEKGLLYQTRHIRPEKDVAIEVDVNGLTETEEFKLPEKGIIRLGAEARGAAFEVLEPKEATLDGPASTEGANGVMIILLSPIASGANFTGDKSTYVPLPGFTKQDADGSTTWKGMIKGDAYTLHCAVTGRAVREGGWDMENHRPRTVQSYIPGGSVFYCTPDSLNPETALKKLHLAQLEQPEDNPDKQLGRGLITAGLWADAVRHNREMNS